MEIPLSGTSAGDTSTDSLPADACDLPKAERPLRAAQFDELFAEHLRDIERCGPQRVRLVLSGDDTLRPQVQRLVEAEASCCSFFSFQLVPLAKAVSPAPAGAVMALDIEVPSTRVEVLDGLVSRADTARRRGP